VIPWKDDAKGAPAATPRRSTWSLREGGTPLFLVVTCFVLAALSFIGASLFANLKLEEVTRLTHSVSENAMPSLAQLGTVRYELVDLGRTLQDAANGEGGDLAAAEESVHEIERAWHAYTALPQFPGEREETVRAEALMDEATRAANRIVSEVRSAGYTKARAEYRQNFLPAATAAESSLGELRHINLAQGTIDGLKADEEMDKTQSISIALDVACTIFTATLAFLAVRLLRRAHAAETKRADELDAFAARVAHDLRGPLSTPLLVLQRLAADLGSGAKQLPLIDRGVRSLKRADSLIRDLLLFARASAAPEPGAHASLPEVVSGAVQDTESEATRAGVSIDVAELPRRDLCCAPGVLSSIVENLLSNAIKYMPPARDRRLVFVRASDADDRVRVEVSDTGAGISADLQKTLFDPYVRGDSTRPGLGLGLATVKRLVQSHGGKVGLESQVGVGSVFWFELPAHPGQPVAALPHAE
jgi:signal transduction histidine kinase